MPWRPAKFRVAAAMPIPVPEPEPKVRAVAHPSVTRTGGLAALALIVLALFYGGLRGREYAIIEGQVQEITRVAEVLRAKLEAAPGVSWQLSPLSNEVRQLTGRLQEGIAHFELDHPAESNLLANQRFNLRLTQG